MFRAIICWMSYTCSTLAFNPEFLTASFALRSSSWHLKQPEPKTSIFKSHHAPTSDIIFLPFWEREYNRLVPSLRTKTRLASFKTRKCWETPDCETPTFDGSSQAQISPLAIISSKRKRVESETACNNIILAITNIIIG